MEPDGTTARDNVNLFGLHLDRRVTLISVVGTLLLMLDYYHRFLPADTASGLLRGKALERDVYYLGIPLFIILVVFRDRPSAYGMSLGDWREGMKWTAAIALVAVPILFVAARTPAMVAYYAPIARPPFEVVLNSGLELFAWEFFFRGFLLFGLAYALGPSAVVIQAIPFAMAHLGKPELETLSTIFGGILFGWVAWRGRSFVYPFFIHWFINVFVILVAMSAAP